MMRPRTAALLIASCIYAIVASLVRDNHVLLLIVTLLFVVISTVLRNFIFIKRDGPDHINITMGGAKITVDDSKITIEDTKKPRDSAKTSS